MSYTPQANDELHFEGKTVKVVRVTPDSVTILDLQGAERDTTKDDFERLANGSIQKGAVVVRGGKQIIPEVVEHVSGSHNTHARLSPSDSKRWTNCTASIAYQEANAHRMIGDGSSEASREGTDAHDWATKVLMKQITEDAIPESFREPVMSYVNHCNGLVPDGELTKLADCLSEAELGFDPPPHAVFVEEQIPLFYQPEQTGTADFIAITPERVFVRDYKHGAGVLVGTQENTQLAIYAYSVIRHLHAAYAFDDDTIVDIAIVQPRHREAGEPTPWCITVGDLSVFCADIEYRAIQARTAAERVREKIGSTGRDVSNEEILEAAPGAVFAPSEGDEGACRWCRCKAFCASRLQANTEGLESAHFDPADLLASMPELSKEDAKQPVENRLALIGECLGMQGRILDDGYLVRTVAKAKAIRSWLSDVEEYLEARLLAGEEIDGIKLVDGREGNREWANADAAETFLRGQGLKQEERFDFKLKSPAAVEKLLKDKLKASSRTKNRFEELIVRSPAKKKLAISDDKRDAVPAAVAMMPAVEDVDDFEV
jgi:hypothetical protein